MSAKRNEKPDTLPKASWLTEFQNDSQFPVYVSLAIVGITLVLLFLVILFRKSSKRRSVLICGPCDAGKTQLFGKLLYKKQIESYTSMQENIGTLSLAEQRKKPVSVVDLPGHERLRYKCFDQHKSSGLAIIYVLDASTITKGIRDATEFLFRILSDPLVHRNRTPVLIVCNKQDLTLAKGATVIERELAKEVGLLRETHSGVLQGTDGNAVVDHVFLGKEGKDFAFSHLKAKLDFCETSALTEENIDKITDWISSQA